MPRNFLVLAAITFAGLALGPAARPAPACPMCAQANETEDKRPQAYQASILFMMSMPMLIAAGFGIGFYRLSRKAAAAAEWDETGTYPVASNPGEGVEPGDPSDRDST